MKVKNFPLSLVIQLVGFLLPIIFMLYFPILSVGKSSELAWIDLLFTIRGTSVPPKNIVIVAIDEPSFQKIGTQWPWPRKYHARLINNLKNAGAKVIAFDIMFAEPSKFPNDDEVFAKALKDAQNVVLGQSISQVQREDYVQLLMVNPVEKLANSCAGIGLLNFMPDDDGIIRHVRKEMNGYPTFAYIIAKLWLKNSQKKQNNLEINNNFYLINYSGPSGTIKTVSYYQVLEMDKYIPKNFFKDKIVIIGLCSEAAVEITRGAVDSFPTPFFRFSKKAMFGVEIHANAVATLLSSRHLKELDKKWLYLIVAILTIFPILYQKKPLKLSLIIGGLVSVMTFISIWMFIYQGLVLKMTTPILTLILSGTWWGLYGFTDTVREKMHLKKAFDKYVSPEVVQEVLKNPSLLNLGGEKRELTVLFSDIRGFTTLSESIPPEKLVYLLNNFFTEMTKYIFSNNGVLDKFIGDAMMVIYGAPIPREDHPYCACKTALEMLYATNEISKSWKSQGLPSIEIGIGINTGMMVIGNMGSFERFDYTVIGDEVNLASRLEGLNKIYGTKIIVGENTCKKVKDDFRFRELDMVKVKGKTKPVRIYELIGKNELDLTKQEGISLFLTALNHYRKGDWIRARELFQKVLTLIPNDGPSLLFIKRCEILIKNPPEKWDGVWTMETK